MSTRAALDLLTVPSDCGEVNRQEFLSDIAPSHKPWDQHRGETDDVSDVYAASPLSRHHKYAERMNECSRVLGFAARDSPAQAGKQKLKLTNARFCRVRFCATCQWRRSLKWQARIHQALPRLVADFPQARFLFLTLTVKNCDIHLLRFTLSDMCRGWKRLTELKAFPAFGWVRSMEITRGRDGGAHPHFHSLLVVQPEYFQAGYLKQPEWAELWRQCLRLDYRPVVDVRVVDPDYEPERRKEMMVEHRLWNVAAEILKYTVKVGDMLGNDKWFLTVSDEVCKTRAVAVGGVLKKYLRNRDRENLINEGEEEEVEDAVACQLFFDWRQQKRRYQKLNT